MTNKKYKLLTDDTKTIGVKTLYRIQALIDIKVRDIKKGDLGGYIEEELNLDNSTVDSSWVDKNSMVYNNSKVYKNSTVDNSTVENSKVENSTVENSKVYDSWVNKTSDVFSMVIYGFNITGTKTYLEIACHKATVEVWKEYTKENNKTGWKDEEFEKFLEFKEAIFSVYKTHFGDK